MDASRAEVGTPSSGSSADAFRPGGSSVALPPSAFLSGGHDGLHPVRLHGHREPHQGELSYRTRALAVHVLARPDLFHRATDDPRSGLQRLQMRPTGSGEFSDRTEPAFPSLTLGLRDWSWRPRLELKLSRRRRRRKCVVAYFFTMRMSAQLSKADCFLESLRIGMKNSRPIQLQQDIMMLRKKAHCQT